MSRHRSRSPLFNLPQINPLNNYSLSPKYFQILQQRKQLPVYQSLPQIWRTLKRHQVLIIQGQTGSGKTTQIPQYLLLQIKGKIACTQPRRVAAISVAKRVAQQLDVQLGQQVGYSVRFNQNSSQNTRLKYLTDGMLLRQTMTDPSLQQYSVIILDEAHQRTISSDIILGMMKELLPERKDLKLVVMSATLQAEKFQQYFGAPNIKVSGRLHHVEILYTPKGTQDYFQSLVRTIIQIHAFEASGDILAFLTGEQQIEEACRAVKREVNRYGESIGKLSVYPLYSSLPPHQQQRIFLEPPQANSKGIPGRKCIISTNIAQTSLTIDGIVYVVDSGLVKEKVYNPRMRVQSLLVTQISKSSAKQRAGRAGRTCPGKCYRLYTHKTYNSLKALPDPEILRSNLASVVLVMKVIGISNLVNFDFMDPPAPETMMRALEVLNYLGALDDEGDLTSTGTLMADFPLPPELSKALIQSVHYKCSEQMLKIVSVLSVPNPFVRPKDQAESADKAKYQFFHTDGDHMVYLNLYEKFQEAENKNQWCKENFVNFRSMQAACEIRNQLQMKMERLGLNVVGNQRKLSKTLRRALLAGYFMQVAYKEKSNYYKTVKENQIVALHPSSVVSSRNDWVVYNDFVITSKNYIRVVSSIEPEWLLDSSQDYFLQPHLPESRAKQEIMKIFKKSIKHKKL